MIKSVSISFIVFFIFLSISNGSVTDFDPDGNARVINELKVQLELDKDQVKKIEAVFSANRSQRSVDINLFKTSSMAMIRAAERRQGITDGRIIDILKDNQKKSFDSYRRKRERGKELFRLREGLLLDRKQEIRIGLIVAEYRNVLNELKIKIEHYIKSGQARKRKSSESGRLLRSRSSGLERRNPEVRKMEQGPIERISGVQNEKAKRIRKYLKREQKILYSEILRFQERELRLFIRKLGY